MVTTVIVKEGQSDRTGISRDKLFRACSGRPGLIRATRGVKPTRAKCPSPSSLCIGIFILLSLALGCELRADDPVLWYRQPAQKWTQILPVGNGRWGALMYGGVWHERIQVIKFNAYPHPTRVFAEPQAFKTREDIRKALASKRPLEAELKNVATLGDLHLEFAGNTNQLPAEYRRQLDLDTALARTTFQMGDVTFTREVLVNRPDQVMVVMIGADKRYQTYFTASLSASTLTSVRAVSANELLLTGPMPDQLNANHLKFAIRLRVIPTSGKVETAGERLKVTGADQALLLLTVATDTEPEVPNAQRESPNTTSERLLEVAAAKDYTVLRAEHISEHQKWFRQTKPDLNQSSATRNPLDERLAACAKGAEDPGLVELFFQYRRYLDKAFESCAELIESLLLNQARF